MLMCQMGPHQVRDKACDLAPVDWAKSAAYAEQIDDPWYACQAFAWCGRFAPPAESTSFIERAFRQAEAGKDAYQQLAATAWPLRALVELGQHDRAEREFDRVAGLASKVQPPSSRSQACLLVYEAVASATPELGRKALRLLLSACQPVQHWRQERAVREAVILAASIYLYDVPDVLLLVQDERLRDRVATRIGRGEYLQPRRFYWSRGHRPGT